MHYRRFSPPNLTSADSPYLTASTPAVTFLPPPIAFIPTLASDSTMPAINRHSDIRHSHRARRFDRHSLDGHIYATYRDNGKIIFCSYCEKDIKLNYTYDPNNFNKHEKRIKHIQWAFTTNPFITDDRNRHTDSWRNEAFYNPRWSATRSLPNAKPGPTQFATTTPENKPTLSRYKKISKWRHHPFP